jgi:uncharacterized membrane protein
MMGHALGFLNTLAMRLGPLEFGDPRWLWALLVLVPIVYLWRTSRVPGGALRKWVSLILRVVLVLAIVASLADTRIVWFNKGICVVFVLDQSQSVPGAARDAIRERIAQEVEKMSKDDRFVVVEFGGDAVLASLPSPKGEMPPPAKVMDTGHTDIARALRLAMASFPADRQKRIVLFSDGNQNQEDALREARIAGVKDVDIHVLALAAQRGHEVMVDQLILPPRVRKDARFAVRAIISADAGQSAKLLVTRDGVPLEPMQVDLKPGSNVFDIPDRLSDGGNHQYQVTVLPDRQDADTFAANNTGYAFTQVDAPGKILLVHGKGNTSEALYNALNAANVPILQVSPSGLPASAAELTAYDCVILDNVNRFDIDNSPQMPALKEWVQNFGGGLVMIGGDNSFGPGGYKGTILEELAPVEMDVKREKHLASLAIAIVLDKSGSMGAPAGGMGGKGTLEKMDLANAGSAEVIKILDASDLAMVGAVDTQVKWMGDNRKLLPMTPNNKASLIRDIESIRSGGGGIYCATALNHAYQLVTAPGINTMSRHVIMFADTCDSEQQENCVAMATKYYLERGVTTSVIGLGQKSDPHAPFQKEVATAGHGRWDATDDAMALPKLFLKEAFMVSRKAFVEKKEGIPPVMYSSPVLEGFLGQGGGVPRVYGYVGTTLKPRSTLAMTGEGADDPLLAHWSIGLGKCVAYTSDSTSRWGRDWVGWNGYQKFWTQVVRWASRSVQANGLTTSTVIDGSEGRVIVDAVDDKGKPLNNLQLQGSVIAPDQSTQLKDIPLEQIAPGRYSGKFPASQRGTYLVAVSEAQSKALVSTGGGVLSYPPEYRELQPNLALLKGLAEASGGADRNTIEGVFTQKPTPVSTFWPLWQMLLVIVTGGLFADVAWRRLNVADWFRRRSPAGMPVVTRGDAAVGALKAVKTGRREVDTQRKTLRDRVEALAAAENVAAAPKVGGVATVDPPVGVDASTPPTHSAPAATADSGEGYANRLMSAKKRAKDQIRDKEKDSA